MVFVVDDLGAWLVGLLADASLKKLTTLVLGSDQERALRQAAKAAVERTAGQLAPSDDEQAQQLATVVGKVFRDPALDAAVARQATLLGALQAGIAAKLAVLDDPDVTGTGQSSAQLPGVPGGMLAETLAGNLVREIMVRGSQGGPLAPLADQLNHDVTHLQGRRLEGMLAQVAGQVRVLAAAGTAPVVSRPVRLLPRPALLAGREELLAGLDARFTGAGKDGLQIAVLCGLGGAGKTSVALEYAHRHLAEVGVAWQFDVEDPTVLAAGFAELAAQLGVRDVAGTRNPVTSVHGVLAAYARQWLLVFDNAPGRAAVEAFLPPAGPGQVLITSQNQNWPPGQAVQVPVLDTEAAARFLVSRTGDADGQAAAGLGAELGGLPLALEQAAAYIGASGGSLARYLESFRQRRARLLARGEPAGHSRTVATTWSLAFTQLERSAPQAVALLRLLACCAPEPVPVRLLLQPRPGLAGDLSADAAAALAALLEDDLAVDDAVAELRRYSLITPAGDELVSVHRLVQAVTADQMPADLARQWRQATAALVGAALPAEPWMSGTWPVYAMLLPHAQATLPDGGEGMARLATYLGSSGSYATARELQRKSLNAREKVLGPQHPDTLAARHELGRWTGEAGDLAAARDLFAGLLPVREQVLGAQHPDTLATRHGLALYTGMAGNITAAQDMFARLLPVREQVLGPHHTDTLDTRHELAHLIGEAGDPAAARDLFAQLLPVREQASGVQHPWTLAARHELGRWTGQAGDPAAARDLFAGLLSDEQFLGPQHPDTQGAQHELARWTGEAGDPAAARDLFARLLPVRLQVLGTQHPYTLITRYELARWTGQAGDPAAARDQFTELLPAIEQVLGPQHPYTLNSRTNLARWTGQAGDPAAARALLAGLLPAFEQVFGAQHPDTLEARHELAIWTAEANGEPSTA